MSRTRRAALVSLVAVWALSAASSGQADVVTLGSPLSASFAASGLCSPVCTFAQTSLPGSLTASPVDGTVVRWRVKDAIAPMGEGFRMRVLHPETFGTFTGAGTSALGVPVSFGTQVFATSLPIQAGDLIGINNTAVGDNIGHAATASSTIAMWAPPLADASTLGPSGSGGPSEIAFNADVQPLPGISSLSPKSGPIAGGTAVTINGHDFTGTTAVSFGSVAASGFTVDSDSKITAVAPKVASPGAVDVHVENPGQSPIVAADRFTYKACVVPNLKGRSLKSTRKALVKAACHLGTVRPKGQTSGRVRAQHPKAGKVLPVGTRVDVTLG